MKAAPEPDAEPRSPQLRSMLPVSLWSLAGYFVRLGTLGFGGPIALAGYMERDLVEVRGWISPAEYKEGLALAQLAPGPLAAQLAIYLGWARFGTLGATLVGIAFVAPSLLMVMGLAALYLHYGGLPWMQRAFYGIGAAVIAIFARSLASLGRLTLGRDVLLWALCGINAVVTAATQSEVVWLFASSGVVVLLVRDLAARRGPAGMVRSAAWVPVGLLSGMQGSASLGGLGQIFWFFAKAGLFVFGSGLAIVPFLYGGVVQGFGWLTERQFLDAVAVSMITPGPVVITVAFIGHLVAGPLGALVAALGVFLPVYLVVIVLAPHFHRIVANGSVRAFVDGVTAAATGAIAGAAFVLGRRALVDVGAAVIGLLVLVAVFRTKIPEPVLIIAAGLVGLLLRGSVLTAAGLGS